MTAPAIAMQGRAHGTRAKYVFEKCRCRPCRIANTRYQTMRYARTQVPWRIRCVGMGRLWLVQRSEDRAVDLLDYNPSRADVEHEREQARIRQGRSRTSRRESRRDAGVTHAVNNGPVTGAPVPVPVPEDLNLSPVSESVADPPDPGLSHHATRAPESPVEVSAAELQQRFAEWRHPDSGAPLLKPEAEWTRFRAWYAKRDPGPNANWHQLADAWLANIVEGYAQAGESKRGPRRVDRPAGEPTSLGDILTSALQKRGVG